MLQIGLFYIHCSEKRVEGMRNKLLGWILSICLLCGLPESVPFRAASAEPAEKEATVLIYMCGSDLESKNFQGTDTLVGINQLWFSQDKMNVVALLGGTNVWGRRYDTSQLTVVELGGRRPKEVDHLPLNSMGDPETLTAFLDYGAAHYPAKSYYLVIWDHGGGPILGVCKDLLFPGDTLSVNELADGIGKSGPGQAGLEMIAFNTCLTGSLEYAVSLAPYAKYMVATEDAMYGLTYDWLKTLEETGDPSACAKALVDGTFELNAECYAANNDSLINSVAAVDLSRVKAVLPPMDAFFARVKPEVTEKDFVLMSRQRRESATFGTGESGGNRNYDLVDLGDLVVHLREHAEPEANDLLSALSDAVFYKRSALDSCYGLTVYHPYSNKPAMERYMAVHNGIPLSAEYSSYIQQFAAILNGEPLAKWAGLSVDALANKDLRVFFALNLTEEQAENLADAEFQVLARQADGGYRKISENPETSLENGQLKSVFSGTALYAVKEDQILSPTLDYEIAGNGTWQIPARLTLPGQNGGEDTTVEGLILCSLDPDQQTLSPGGVLIYDETVGGYTGIHNLVFTDFSEVSFPIVSRKETRGADGVLAGFRDWDTVTEDYWTSPIDGSWAFRLRQDTVPLSDCFASFLVTDAQQNHYTSELKQIQSDKNVTSLVYDNMDLLEISPSFQVSLMEDSGTLMLGGELENISEKEVIVTLKHLTVNGESNEAETQVYGSGENWGILPAEKAYLSLFLPLEGLNIEGGLSGVQFDLEVSEAGSENVLGSVPVSVNLDPASKGQ